MARILCIIDGMSDPGFNPERYPTMASFPERTLVKTVPEGHEPETLPCVLTLLGVTPPRNIRGWIEALGAGVDINEQDLIFRGSWMQLDNNGAYEGFTGAPENFDGLRHARYIPLDGYRCLLVMPGHSAYADKLEMKPPYELFNMHPRNCNPTGIPLLDRELSHINESYPGRALALWSASAIKALPGFPQKAAVVTGTNVVKGIAKALGMRLVTSPSMTGDTDTDLSEKTTAALNLAEEYPFVLLHIGGCDEAAHRKNKLDKEMFLKRVDEIVLAELLRSKHEIAAASDHGCDPAMGKHTGEPQPYFKRMEIPQ
jgi:2,3-bisphosphoglycerate-independent phosphoglycerate mutase